MYDGNFSAELFKPKVPEDDVRLTNGAGFMVSQDRYHAHLKVVTEIKQVRSVADVLGRDTDGHRNEHVMNMRQSTEQTSFSSTLFTQALEVVAVLAMDAGFYIQLWISNDGKCKSVSLKVFRWMLMRLAGKKTWITVYANC